MGHAPLHAVVPARREVTVQSFPVIPGRRHSASKTRVNALMAADPESRNEHGGCFWIPGSQPSAAPRNDA
jgi:hypothetical protein